MGTKVDMIGKRFGNLVVLEDDGHYRNEIAWICLCDCGELSRCGGYNLRSGNTKTCGCSGVFKKTHGMTGTPIYRVWMAMRQRCYLKSSQAYKDYGGRGIFVCDRWQSFENFYADMGDPPSGDHEIDRRNNDGNYEPRNCRWATRAEQSRNTRANVFLTFKGKTQCAADWANEIGISRSAFSRRLRMGWPPEKAISQPVDTSKISR